MAQLQNRNTAGSSSGGGDFYGERALGLQERATMEEAGLAGAQNAGMADQNPFQGGYFQTNVGQANPVSDPGSLASRQSVAFRQIKNDEAQQQLGLIKAEQERQKGLREWAQQAINTRQQEDQNQLNWRKQYTDEDKQAYEQGLKDDQYNAGLDQFDATEEQRALQNERQDKLDTQNSEQTDFNNDMRVAEFKQNGVYTGAREGYRAQQADDRQRQAIAKDVWDKGDAWADSAIQAGHLQEEDFYNPDKGMGRTAKPALNAWKVEMGKMAGDPLWDNMTDGERARIAGQRSGMSAPVVAPENPGKKKGNSDGGDEEPTTPKNPYADIPFPKDAPLELQLGWDQLQQNPKAPGAQATAQLIRSGAWRNAPQSPQGGVPQGNAQLGYDTSSAVTPPTPPRFSQPQQPQNDTRSAFDQARGGAAAANENLKRWETGQQQGLTPPVERTSVGKVDGKEVPYTQQVGGTAPMVIVGYDNRGVPIYAPASQAQQQQ